MKVKEQIGKPAKVKSAKKVQETQEHKRLKTFLAEIITACGFKTDTEVALNFSGNRDESGDLTDERSIDIVAYGSNKNMKFLIVFECKGGNDIKSIHSKISSWEADIEKIRKNQARIISSEKNEIKDSDFRGFDEICICYVFGNSIPKERFETLASTLKGRNFFAWDMNSLTYYRKTVSTIGKAVKFEFLKEFNINLESGGQFSRNAIRIKQGDLEMFILGAQPSVLLKIGYVYRRASGKPAAYQ